jgi:hypothetical protein
MDIIYILLGCILALCMFLFGKAIYYKNTKPKLREEVKRIDYDSIVVNNDAVVSFIIDVLNVLTGIYSNNVDILTEWEVCAVDDGYRLANFEERHFLLINYTKSELYYSKSNHLYDCYTFNLSEGELNVLVDRVKETIKLEYEWSEEMGREKKIKAVKRMLSSKMI